MSRKFFIDLSLVLQHFSDYDGSLLPSHLLYLPTPNLILRHIGHLEHHAGVLKIRTDSVHLLDYLIDAMALQKFFLHQMKDG